MFKCLGCLIVLALLAGGVYLGHGIIFEKAGKLLLKQDTIKPADVIVVLGGEKEERVIYAAKLYKEGWARKDRIIMTGGPAVWKYTWAGMMKEQAEALGIPGKNIILEDVSRSTEEDAVYVRGILKMRGYKSIILVTSPYHSKRASVIFTRLLGRDIKIINAPTEESWFKFDAWWKRQRDRDMVLQEFSKFIRLWLFGAIREGETKEVKDKDRS